ncbi:hypothetical protein M0Q50_03475 [bacterium]|jgi:hypothetical protein|nr:hypothetical protein [bacterium]
MKTFEQFENINELEKSFLELAHLDELEIKFDFMRYESDIFYFHNYKCLFKLVKKNVFIYINSDEIWSVFENKFGLDYIKTTKFMGDMIHKHFKLNSYKISKYENWLLRSIDNHFKLNVKKK